LANPCVQNKSQTVGVHEVKLVKNWCSELASRIRDVLERNQFVWTWKVI